MAESFDPYYTWLGIPPHEQPANYYRLLGLSPFEANAEVISNAADRLMLHLRAFQAGKRSKESQQLLNEVSTARVTLLDPAKKANYDADVRTRMLASAPGGDLRGAASVTLPVARPIAVPETAAIKIEIAPRTRPPAPAAAGLRAASRPAKPVPLVLIVAFIAAALLAIGGGIAFLLSHSQR